MLCSRKYRNDYKKTPLMSCISGVFIGNLANGQGIIRNSEPDIKSGEGQSVNPAGLALVAFCISVGCNYTFVHVFGLPAMYLALTTSIVTTLNFVFYFLYIRHLLGGMACHILLPGVLRIVAAGAVLAACCWALGYFCFGEFTSWNFLARFGALAAAGVLGAGVYVAACMVFRVPELQMLTARLRRR